MFGGRSRSEGYGHAGVHCRERRGEHSTAAAVASAEHRLRPVLATSALRLSTAETAVFPLYARDGRAHHRDTERPVPESCGPVSYTHLRAHETVLDLVCR